MKTSGGGFTLVEILVASAVAVLVAAAAAAALGTAFRGYARAADGRRTDAALARLAFFEALRSDLACAAPVAGSFEGDAHTLRLARLSAPDRGAPSPRLWHVRWAPTGGGAAVRRTAERKGEAPRESVHPFAPRFSYARPLPPEPGAPTNAPPRHAWEDTWNAPRLPAAVRVNIGTETWDVDILVDNFEND